MDENEMNDIAAPDYGRPLANAAAPIWAQNRDLIARARKASFDPAGELDYSRNGAVSMLQDLYETIAMYEEGKVPYWVAEEAMAGTDMLLKVLVKRRNAPVRELDDVGVRIRESRALWARGNIVSGCPREQYLKRLFASRNRIFEAFRALHGRYVELAQKKRNRRGSYRRKFTEEQRQIFREIVCRVERGAAITKAIRDMATGGWVGRMRGVSQASWRKYFTEWRGS